MAKRRKKTNKNVPAKGRLRDMADHLWSTAVHDDWANKCAVCGRGGAVDAHHLFPRQWTATRYELRNGIALCALHHKFDAATSPHMNAMGWVKWLGAHHRELSAWYTDMEQSEDYKQFDGTKTALFYCDIITDLRQYVMDDDYRKICGVKFSAWLDNERK